MLGHHIDIILQLQETVLQYIYIYMAVDAVTKSANNNQPYSCIWNLLMLRLMVESIIH